MSNTDYRFNAFQALRQALIDLKSESSVLERTTLENPWFTSDNVQFCVDNWINALADDQLTTWMPKPAISAQTVGVICAGNIPMVGLHDVLCVIASGHKPRLKLSSSDKVLMRYAIRTLNDNLSEAFQIEESEQIKKVGAVIATGSNNTSRYFEYYFNSIPHIIRKNRTGVAVLTGEESTEDLKKLGDDIFRYFGLGCRNVTKIYIPRGYDFEALVKALEPHSDLINHHKFANNYTYHKAIFLMNLDVHLDTGFLLFKEDDQLHAPLSCVFYEYYQNLGEVNLKLEQHADEIQVCVGNHIPGNLPFGTTQQTGLFDYADKINTLEFLDSLSES